MARPNLNEHPLPRIKRLRHNAVKYWTKEELIVSLDFNKSILMTSIRTTNADTTNKNIAMQNMIVIQDVLTDILRKLEI